MSKKEQIRVKETVVLEFGLFLNPLTFKHLKY